ncbi:MAG: type II secretion system protein M [Gammaproteobacteria bacterium]|nr:type II secretion system protein M [Gammaproteobacteria bacterium]MCP5425806.1 type II secretion system protein M [Gammaproteobacteria bacterium]MCP5458583.1 type II secretion system protein M [Gammaproteobacteria bacterium]
MKDWWQALNRRERWILGGGAAVLVALMVYVLLWEPQRQRIERLRQTVATQRAEIAWMREAAAEVQRLSRAPISGTSPQDSRSMLTVVDSSATGANLGGSVKRVEPQGDDRLRVQLEHVEFDALIRWLADLQKQRGIVADNVALEGQSDGRRVNARLVLRRETP